MGPLFRIHNETVLKTLTKGDAVEFRSWGRPYSHWGIYDGNGNIIHLAGVDVYKTVVDSSMSNVFTSFGPGLNKACVKKNSFWDVARNSWVVKNNNKDTIKAPFCGSDILKRASSCLGPQPYSLRAKNCEHFTAWSRNGIHVSFQVNTAFTVAGVVVAVVVVGCVAYKLYVHREKVATTINYYCSLVVNGIRSVFGKLLSW